MSEFANTLCCTPGAKWKYCEEIVDGRGQRAALHRCSASAWGALAEWKPMDKVVRLALWLNDWDGRSHRMHTSRPRYREFAFGKRPVRGWPPGSSRSRNSVGLRWARGPPETQNVCNDPVRCSTRIEVPAVRDAFDTAQHCFDQLSNALGFFTSGRSHEHRDTRKRTGRCEIDPPVNHLIPGYQT
jgi:hypothetical protein